MKIKIFKDLANFFRFPEHLKKEQAEARKKWRKEAHDELARVGILEISDSVFYSNNSQNYDAFRRLNNGEVLKAISNFMDQNPNLRFNQALIALDVVRDEHDDFNTEPWEIRRRIDVRLKELNKTADVKGGRK